MDAGNFFAGLSSSDDSTTHHHHHHDGLGMVISFTVLACGIMLEDCCGLIAAAAILVVLVGLMDGLSMEPIGNENAKNLQQMTPAAIATHRATDQGEKTPFISLSSPFLERIDFEDTSMDGLSITTMKPTGNENAKNLTPPAADQGKQTPFISLSPPVLEETKMKSEDTDPRKDLEKPSNLVAESKRKPESIDSELERRSNAVLESKRKSEHINQRNDLEKPSNLVVLNKKKPESSDSRKGHKKRSSPVFESKRKSKIVDSGLEKQPNPVLESKRKSGHIDSRKGPEKRLRPVVEGKMKPENIGSRKGHVKRSNLVVESKKKSNNIDLGKEHQTRLRPAVESKKKSGNTDLRFKQDKKGHEKQFIERIQAKLDFVSMILENRRKSEHIGLVGKQDKQVVGTQRTSPCFAPAHGDASVVVRSGFVRPTLIRDGKSIGYENRQGKDKQLTSVMESRRKSEKVDLNRKQDKNVVNMHRMIPHVVSASISELVQPTSISKGSKPIESQKHKRQEKRLISVVENGRKSEHIGLVRKQDKQVVGTHRSITGVIPAQGHIPVVRSGLVRPTLIQKDSKSFGSEKLQGSEKLLSSFVESKKKSGKIDSMRKNDKKVVGTRKDLVDERSLRLVSKQKNVKAVPQVPPDKGRKINFTSDLKTGWKF